jgi:hypothetical protein
MQASSFFSLEVYKNKFCFAKFVFIHLEREKRKRKCFGDDGYTLEATQKQKKSRYFCENRKTGSELKLKIDHGWVLEGSSRLFFILFINFSPEGAKINKKDEKKTKKPPKHRIF